MQLLHSAVGYRLALGDHGITMLINYSNKALFSTLPVC